MKKISYAIEATFIHLIFFIFKMMPVATASNVGGWIGKTVGPKLAASRKALSNIRASFPNKTPDECQLILNGMWENLGRVIAEYPHLKTICEHHTKLIGIDILKSLPADQPVIFFSAHVANWEVASPSVILHRRRKMNLVYRAPNNPYLCDLLDQSRLNSGDIATIPKSKRGARDIVRALSSGEDLGILIDQKYNEGIAVPFFGRPAMTSPAFIQLAQKFKCPLIPIQVTRTGGCAFEVTVHPPLNIQDMPLETAMTNAHTLLEGWISAAPAQWLWLHRRWDSDALKSL